MGQIGLRPVKTVVHLLWAAEKSVSQPFRKYSNANSQPKCIIVELINPLAFLSRPFQKYAYKHTYGNKC